MTILPEQTILVVEDDEGTSFGLSHFLETEGYNVLLAENGAVALEILKKHSLPQLILLDMMMPVMNGWQFASEFAAKFDHRVPIVVMTAAADAEQRAIDIQASAWIEKPFDLDKLLGLIKEHMKK